MYLYKRKRVSKPAVVLLLFICIVIFAIIFSCTVLSLRFMYNKKIVNLEEIIIGQQTKINYIQKENELINKLYETKCNELELIKEKEDSRIAQLALVSGVLKDRINNEDLRVQLNLPTELFNEVFKGTPMEGLGNAITKAEREYGVNALFIAAVAAHESDAGRSNIAQSKNNLYGFTAYDSSPYQSATTFNNFEHSVDRFANLISRSYLDEDGSYFNGYTIEDINVKYATDKKWSLGVRKWINTMIQKNAEIGLNY